MTIGKLAEAAGVNVETIRYYQRRGWADWSPIGLTTCTGMCWLAPLESDGYTADYDRKSSESFSPKADDDPELDNAVAEQVSGGEALAACW